MLCRKIKIFVGKGRTHGKGRKTCSLFLTMFSKAFFFNVANTRCYALLICVIDRTVLSMDPSLAQALIDHANINRSRCTNDGWLCTTDHPW